MSNQRNDSWMRRVLTRCGMVGANTQVLFLPPEAIEYLITRKSESKRRRHPRLMIKYISLDPPDVTKSNTIT